MPSNQPPPPASDSSAAFPRALRDAEARMLRVRRAEAQVGLDGPSSLPASEDESGDVPFPGDTVGIALSGGGIRSATFALGFVQALADAKLLAKIDYLSTVSGGGYLGSFLHALIARDPDVSDPGGSDRTKRGSVGIERAREVLADRASREVDWLRENGRYLAPNGSGDNFLAWATYMRNWAAIHAVLVALALFVFSAASLLRAALLPDLLGWSWASILWSPYLALPLAVLIVLTLPLGTAFWLVRRGDQSDRTRSDWVAVVLGPVLFVFFAAFAVAFKAVCHVPTATLWNPSAMPKDASIGPPLITWIAILFSCISLLATLAVWVVTVRVSGDGATEPLVRNKLSTLYSSSLLVVLSLLVLAVIDSLGQTLYAWLATHQARSAAVVGVGGASSLLAGAAKLSNVLGWGTSKKRVSLPASVIAGAVAAVLVLVLAVSLSALTHGFAWGWKVPPLPPWQGSVSRRDVDPADPDTWEHAVVQPESGHVVVLPLPGKVDHAEVAAPIQMDPTELLLVLAVTALTTWLFGQNIKFLNYSSLQNFYGSRLTRAYLGASNPLRFDPTNPIGRRVTDAMRGDDVHLEEAAIWRRGGPLHLVNVTVNETTSGETQVDQSDRKGVPLAVGPAGMSGGIRHHALWDGVASRGSIEHGKPEISTGTIRPIEDRESQFQMFAVEGQVEHPVERLTLGTWTSISGAAFSTGLGARTSLGLSMLLGLANIRLGYWWDSHILPSRRTGRTAPRFGSRLGELATRLLPVQSHLYQELVARFYGPQRQRWNLSDGGHFENTACYELIRRRVPFIICCDDGEDPDYLFEDVGNLVRKARTDFGAEIRILDRATVNRFVDERFRHIIGALEDFEKPHRDSDDGTPTTRAHALLAWVFYDDGKHTTPSDDTPPALAGSMILFVKPSLTGDEPVDVRNYRALHPEFPQQSTVDQYFDDAQWESYRRLGEHIGRSLFPSIERNVLWCPKDLAPPHGA